MAAFRGRRQGRQQSPNTYFVQDRMQEELVRLRTQDEMVTHGMGGVLAEQSDPGIFQRVLDVGSGTGGWLIEMAKLYPDMPLLMGIDINNRMVIAAREQARAQQVSDRVEFHTMDALRHLEFPDAYFDLVNQRLGFSFLRIWDWPGLLQQYQRITRPGGTIRITEAEPIAGGNSPALTRLGSLLLQAFHQAGHLFTAESDGLTSHLAEMVGRYGLLNIQTQVHPLQYHAGTRAGQQFCEDARDVFRTSLSFMRKWGKAPDDYEELYQQALNEMQQPDFVATWNLLTVWGTVPTENG